MAYERLDPKKSSDWISGHADHMARYRWAKEFVAGKRVLDAGTGTGYGAAYLKYSGAAEVIGVDIDDEAVIEASRNFVEPSLTYRVSDCEVLQDVGSAFDVICSFENIEHLKNPRRFLAAAATILGPQGLLLCSSPDSEGTDQFGNFRPPNPYHIEEWNRKDFRALMLEYFEDVEMHVQVCTFSCRNRLNAAVALSLFLNRMLPTRIARVAKRLVGRSFSVLDATAVATPGPEDFPIVTEKVAQFIGHPACHVAVCRKPRSIS